MNRFFATLVAFSSLALTQIASAADMPVKTPGPAIARIPWTGFYVGVNGGYGWGNTSANIVAFDPATRTLLTPPFSLDGSQFDSSFRESGWFGGIQAGYNWQLSSTWLVGFETDFQFADIRGSSSKVVFFDPPDVGASDPFTVNIQRKLQWFGTVRARLGYLLTPNLLLYGTGGLAYGKTQTGGAVLFTPLSGGFTGIGVGGANGSFSCGSSVGVTTTCYAGSNSRTSVGWTAGAGLEYMLLANLTAKLEYLHIALGDQTLTLVSPPPSTPGIFINYQFDREAIDLVRVGLNYKFN